MELTTFPLLSAVIFLPFLGALAVLLSDHRNAAASQVIGILFSLASLGLCFAIVWLFPLGPGMAFMESHSWIPSIGARYILGVDGISLVLVTLTALLTVISLLASWDEFGSRSGLFVMLMLSLEGSVIGVFLALDLLLFYVFWEAMLIPMYFLIGLYGGPKRVYATTKFVLVTLFGSLLMLLAIITLGINFQVQSASGDLSFALSDIQNYGLSPGASWFCCIAFLLAFAIKVPMWPFHTWLPDAHTEAPTAGSVILAGVLLKMGTYGMLRFLIPLFPNVIADIGGGLLILSTIAIIYGALTAMVQADIKRLIACSSVSHMGFITLGLFSLNPEGVLGGAVQMLNHGISTGALFLMAGMIHHRTHTRLIKDLSGMAYSMPLLSTVFVFFSLSSIGLPGLNGFVGEFLILLGAFTVSPIMTAIAALGIVFGAVYLLWMIQRVFFGPPKGGGPVDNSHHDNHLDSGGTHEASNSTGESKDLSILEIILLLPLAIGVLYIGLKPAPVINLVRPPIIEIVEKSKEKMKLDNEKRNLEIPPIPFDQEERFR
ncbi:NADH-quinone oxidoreductase subunit M [bacterium]|nr:NADH-quinone oxidoreductase subunit M [bacterium]